MTTITMFVDGQIAGSHFHALTVELVTALLAAQPNKGQTKWDQILRIRRGRWFNNYRY